MAMLWLLLLGGMMLRESYGQAENCGDAESSTGYKTVLALNTAAIAGAGPFSICPNAILSDGILRPMIDGTVFQCPAASCIFNTSVAMDADNIRVSIVGITFANFKKAVISGSAGSNSTLELRQVIFRVRILYGWMI
jgi:hypothetical protein